MRKSSEKSGWRTGWRFPLAMLYVVAGWFHLTAPQQFLRITPPWVPAADQVILLTGIAELLGAAGLVQPFSSRLKKAAGVGLAVYALCVWPANFNHMLMDMALPDRGWGLAYHVPRMLAQPVLIWMALWSSDAVDWPFDRRRAAEPR